MSELSGKARKRGICSLLRRRGGVLVSTGVWKWEQRADAPNILKMGKKQLNANNNVELVAA